MAISINREIGISLKGIVVVVWYEAHRLQRRRAKKSAKKPFAYTWHASSRRRPYEKCADARLSSRVKRSSEKLRRDQWRLRDIRRNVRFFAEFFSRPRFLLPRPSFSIIRHSLNGSSCALTSHTGRIRADPEAIRCVRPY